VQIPAETFAAIQGRLCGQPQEHSPERRKAARIVLSRLIFIVPLEDGKPGQAFQVVIRDISTTGIGLLCGQAMARGSAFVVRLPVESDYLWIYCRVVRCEPADSNLFIVGAEFVERFASEALPMTPAH
jgi:hypothetical protein